MPPTPAPSGLPRARCLVAAIATPLSPDFRPDQDRLLARAQALMAAGCDGITLFGTTGEGAEFAVADRIAALEALLAAGVPARRLIVSAGALSIPDVARLAAHATDAGVDGVLLMPPTVFRDGITEDATFRYYDTVIARIDRPGLRLYLYHFPGISGVPITPQVVRRLDERHPGTIAGIKDSGGDAEFSAELTRRFSHLSLFIGSETQLPDLVGQGVRGDDLRPRQRDAALPARARRRPHRLRPPRLPAGAPPGRRHPLAPPLRLLGQGGHRRRPRRPRLAPRRPAPARAPAASSASASSPTSAPGTPRSRRSCAASPTDPAAANVVDLRRA